MSAGEVDHELVDDAFEWRSAREMPGGASVQRGREAVRRELERQLDAWDEVSFEPQEFAAVGADDLLVRVRMHGVGRGSGVSVEREIFHLWTYRREKAARVRVFFDRGEAIEAAGSID